MTEPRRPGRPKGQPSVEAMTRLPPDVFAMLCRMSRRRDESISELIRRAVLQTYRVESVTSRQT